MGKRVKRGTEEGRETNERRSEGEPLAVVAVTVFFLLV
jgi:hypothetical protein